MLGLNMLATAAAIAQDADRVCSGNGFAWFLSGFVLEQTACDALRPQSQPERARVMAEVRNEHRTCFLLAEANPEFAATIKRHGAAVTEQVQKNPATCDHWSAQEISKVIMDMKAVAAPLR